MNEMARTGMAAIAVVLAGVAGLAWATAGFQALTSETARRQLVIRSPVDVPPAVLLDGTELLTELADDGRVALIDFVYTRCTTLCRSLGSEYQQAQQLIRFRGLDAKIRLLTISFDPENDDLRILSDYAARWRADPRIWRITTIPSRTQLSAQMKTFGIIAVPAGGGDYVHNAAIHVVTPDGRLHRIRDLGQWRQALADALALAH